MAQYTGLLTDNGRRAFNQWLCGNVTNPSELYLSIGSGSTAASQYDRNLESPHFGIARVAATKYINTLVPLFTLYAIGTITLESSATIREVGFWDAIIGGNLLYRGVRAADIDAVEDDTYTATMYWCFKDYAGGNTFVTAGLTECRDLVADYNTPAGFTYLAWGTGTGAESAAGTTLGTEKDRQVASYIGWSKYAPNDTIRYSYTFTVAAAGTVSEIAVFNAASTGTMLFRKLLATPIVVTVGQKITIVADVTSINYTDPSICGMDVWDAGGTTEV